MIIKKNNFKKFLLFLTTLQLIGCVIKSYTLQNGVTKVPYNSDLFKNKSKFDKSILAIVDTSVIYEEFNQRYNVLSRFDTNLETRIYDVYRFYSDGKFNNFLLDRKKQIDVNDFNPEFNGYRGVYYLENGKIKFDLFAESNELGWLGELNGTFTFIGDTLYVKNREAPNNINIYIKRKLPSKYLQFNGNW